MAEKRMISSHIHEDEWFGLLDPFDMLIWQGLITTIADDQGRFLFNIYLIKSKLFPYQNIDIVRIDKALDGFAKDKKLFVYNTGDKTIGQLVNWWNHQNPSWAMPSKYMAPEGWIDRIRYHTANREIKEANWNTPGGYADSELPIALPSGLSSALDRGIEKSKSKSKSKSKLREEEEESQEEATDKPTAAAAAVEFGEVIRTYEQNIGILTPLISDMLKDWYKTYGNFLTCDAIQEAVKNNVRKPAYIDAILKNWGNNGRGARAGPGTKPDYTGGAFSEFIQH